MILQETVTCFGRMGIKSLLMSNSIFFLLPPLIDRSKLCIYIGMNSFFCRPLCDWNSIVVEEACFFGKSSAFHCISCFCKHWTTAERFLKIWEQLLFLAEDVGQRDTSYPAWSFIVKLRLSPIETQFHLVPGE